MIPENAVCAECNKLIEPSGRLGVTGAPLFACECTGWVIFKRDNDTMIGGIQWANFTVPDVSELPEIPLQARMV